MSNILPLLELIGLCFGFVGQFLIITEIFRYGQKGSPEIRDYRLDPKGFRRYKLKKYIAVFFISLGVFLQAVPAFVTWVG